MPVSIVLNKDDAALFNFTLTKTDTTIIDTTLQAGKTYIYQTSAVINGKEEKSDTLKVSTLDTTSHDFTWQTFTFGDADAGSSQLFNVTIISEDNIWCVGDIYVADSSENGYTNYNAVHWDGSKWELLRIPYYYQNQPYYNPIQTIFSFGKNDLWFCGNGVIHWDGIKYNPISSNIWGPHQINKLWGVSNNNLYIVGNDGQIAHYQNGQWSKVESGTTTNINDIWGYSNTSNNSESVLCVASNIFHQGELRLLAISGNNAHDTLNWPYTNHWLKSVWFKDKYSPVYIGGGGIKKYERENWKELDVTNNFVECIRGSDVNNIFTCGDYGFIAHFDGLHWQTYNNIYNDSVLLSIAVNNDMAVIVGYTFSGSVAGQAIIIVGKRNN